MINFQTYRTILQKPIDRQKLFDPTLNFDFSIYDDYAMYYATKFLDSDLLNKLESVGVEVNMEALFDNLTEYEYDPKRAIGFKKQIQELAESVDLWYIFTEVETAIEEKKFESFAKYFHPYVDDFSTFFKKRFFSDDRIYKITSRATFDFIKDMIKNCPITSEYNLINMYLGKGSLDAEKRFISKKFIEEFVLFFMKEVNLDKKYIYYLNVSKMAGTFNFSEETIKELLKLSCWESYDRFIFNKILEERRDSI